MAPILEHFYPEVTAGGFTRVDGTIEFYTRIHSLMRPEHCILDFGAGRGVGPTEDPVEFRRALMNLKGKCKRVIGVDVDPSIRSNPSLDEAHVLLDSDMLPFHDEFFDIIVSDATFEHLQKPNHAASELARVVKPGGWICARTPNRWGYIGLGTNLIPNGMHVRLLRHLQPQRQAVDVFPTTYRLNSFSRLRTHFPASLFEHVVYGFFPEPAYFGNAKLLWRIATVAFRATPEAFAPVLMVFLRKRTSLL
jgi:SAM-dependent methyltransferase